MTTEEKARAYDEALSRASKLRVQNPFDTVSQMMEHVFPELAESDDERIRKWLICGMNALKDQKNETFATIPIDDCITWLEKQGKKPIDDLTQQEAMDIAVAKCFEQGEQKPAWSEEDECYMNECISAIATKDGWSFEEKFQTKHWLKSLKQRMGGEE